MMAPSMRGVERSSSASIRHQLIPLHAKADWQASLHGIPHAFGHTWENCYAMHLTSGHDTYLYTFEDGDVRIVCPIAERPFRGHVDIVTPYGFSGFAGVAPHPTFTSHWQQFAAARGYVCAYIGLHPLLYEPSYYEPSATYQYNEIHVLDLTLSLDELFSNLSTNRRRQLRAAYSSAFIFEHEPLLAFLQDHCLDFFQARGATAVYHFTPETIAALAAQDNVLLIGAQGESGLESVIMLAFTPHIGEYVLNVHIGSGQQHTVPLLWQGTKALKELGVQWFNLGGGVRPDDGIARFKARFGGQVLPLRSLKQVFNTTIYRQLCRHTDADPQDRRGYFPSYRGM